MIKKLFIFFILISCSPLLIAEVLSGTVSDEGEPVPQADVMLINAANNVLIKKIQTNERGEYRFSVNPGIYKIRAFKEEYAYAWRKEIAVSGSDIIVNIEMIPAAFVDSDNVEKSDDCE